MRLYLLMFLFIITGCSTVTNVINHTDINNIDFNKLKNSKFSIYSSDLIASIQRTSNFNFDVKSSNILEYTRDAFESLIPSVELISNPIKLPGSYNGELSLNAKSEMQSFLQKQKSDYVFIVINSSRDITVNFTKETAFNFGNPANMQTPGAPITNLKDDVKSKVSVNIEVWDVKKKKIVLDYEINQSGHGSIKKSIYKAIEFIKRNGKLSEEM